MGEQKVVARSMHLEHIPHPSKSNFKVIKTTNMTRPTPGYIMTESLVEQFISDGVTVHIQGRK